MEFPKTGNNTFLIIDQGNTLTKIALFDHDTLIWLRYFNKLSAHDVQQLELDKINISAGIISSVAVDPVSLLSILPDTNWLILDHNTPVPIANRYHTPETLGNDRLAGAVAASKLFTGSDVLVIDAGTAITYDIVTGSKEYLGGSISPGLTIRFKGLNTFTGKLPLIESISFNEITGYDTRESILSGVMNGTRFEMDGFIREYKEKYPDLRTILTGGDAIYFDKKLKSNIFAFPNLVIDGLKLILQYNLEK